MAENGGWMYRIVRRVVDGHEMFAVHEAFYDAAGKVWSITEGPVAPAGKTRDEAIADLTAMLADCLGAQDGTPPPVLDFDQIPEPGAVAPDVPGTDSEPQP
jgi:hypothetical protein